MFSHLSAQILLVVHTVTSYGEWRPRDCTRVFYFDFEKHRGVEEGAGGIWQGQEGDVLFKGGKAWLDGNGSLIYPFFSNNDLRPSFALSFKVKPARLRTNGRVAIISNGLAPGSSTLTVFHNETCLGVKVVETEEPPPWAKEAESSRKVELSVDYRKYKQRGKRSAEPNDANGSQTTGNLTSGLHTGSGNGASGVEDPGEGDSFSNLGQEEGQREDNGPTYEAALTEALIAVRKLFRKDGKLHKPKSGLKTTTSATTTSTTEIPLTTQGDTDDSDNNNDQQSDKDNGDSTNHTRSTHPTTTVPRRVTLSNIIARPDFFMPASRYEVYQKPTTEFSRTTVPTFTISTSSTTSKSVPTTTSVKKSTSKSVMKSTTGSETLPVQQTTPSTAVKSALYTRTLPVQQTTLSPLKSIPDIKGIPVKQATPSPAVESIPDTKGIPVKQTTPSPAVQSIPDTEGLPVKQTTPSPTVKSIPDTKGILVKQTTPSPAVKSIPDTEGLLVKQTKPSPTVKSIPDTKRIPVKQTTPSPAVQSIPDIKGIPVEQTTPSPSVQSIPDTKGLPVKQTTPSPAVKSIPDIKGIPVEQTTPSPSGQSIPDTRGLPVKQTTPSPAVKSVPDTETILVKQATPAPFLKSVSLPETLLVQQKTPGRLIPVVIGRLPTAFTEHKLEPPRIKTLPIQRPETTDSRGNDRFLYVSDIFRGMQDENPEEIEVRLAQDGGVLSLQVGNSAIQKTLVGSMEHMKAPHSALRVGVGDGLRPYRGSFDEFKMYDCVPRNFFKTPGNIWRSQNS